MVSIGEGNKQSALRAIQSLGATNIIVRSQRPPESQQVGSQQKVVCRHMFGMTAEDYATVKKIYSSCIQLSHSKQLGLRSLGEHLAQQVKRSEPYPH